MKRAFCIVSVILLCVCSSVNVFANDNYYDIIKNSYNNESDLTELKAEIYDANGRLIEPEYALYDWSINGSTIEAQQTKYYFPAAISQGFLMEENASMLVQIKSNINSRIRIGLLGGNEFEFTGNFIEVTLTAFSQGYHKLYIKNLGTNSITVSGNIYY